MKCDISEEKFKDIPDSVKGKMVLDIFYNRLRVLVSRLSDILHEENLVISNIRIPVGTFDIEIIERSGSPIVADKARLLQDVRQILLECFTIDKRILDSLISKESVEILIQHGISKYKESISDPVFQKWDKRYRVPFSRRSGEATLADKLSNIEASAATLLVEYIFFFVKVNGIGNKLYISKKNSLKKDNKNMYFVKMPSGLTVRSEYLI